MRKRAEKGLRKRHLFYEERSMGTQSHHRLRLSKSFLGEVLLKDRKGHTHYILPLYFWSSYASVFVVFDVCWVVALNTHTHTIYTSQGLIRSYPFFYPVSEAKLIYSRNICHPNFKTESAARLLDCRSVLAWIRRQIPKTSKAGNESWKPGICLDYFFVLRPTRFCNLKVTRPVGFSFKLWMPYVSGTYGLILPRSKKRG
jgi:hypothetical protein